MIELYDEKFEEVILAKLRDHEARRQWAEMRLESVRSEMLEAERAVEHWRFVLEDYRKSHGLPVRNTTHSPILGSEYSGKGPTELVQFWADKHDGEVVVKDLAKVAFKAGLFPNYRNASSSIYAVVKRKGYDRVGPGHFRKAIRAGSVDSHRFAFPFETKEDKNEQSIDV